MTETEDLELQRLEVNIRRLVQLVSAQDERIKELQAQVGRQHSELQSLREALEEQRAEYATGSLSQALSLGTGDTQAARALLDELILEVEQCIQQLRQE